MVIYQEIGKSLSAVDANLERYLVIRGVEYKETVEANLQTMVDALILLQEGDDPTQEDPFLFEELSDSITQLQSDVHVILDLQAEASSREINQNIIVVYDELDKATQLQEELSILVAEELDLAAQTQSQIAGTVVTQSVIIGIIAVSFTVITTITTDRRLRSINTLTDTATAIAEGDLTRTAPIESNDEIGTLAVAFNTMTSQLRAALEDLEQQVTERTQALETSTEVSRQLSTILDQDQLVREVVEQLRSAFGYYHAQIYLFDESKQSLNMVGGTGNAGRTMLASGHQIEGGRGLVGRAAQTNQIVLISDVSQAVGWLPNPLLPDTKAEAAVPIAVGDEVVGVLDVQHNVAGGLRQQDADLIQAIANQVGVAIQNAQAFTRSQRQAVREAQITAISQRIQSANSIEDVLKIAVSELGQALDADRADIEVSMANQSNGGLDAS